MSEPLKIRRRHREKHPLPLSAAAGSFALGDPLPTGPGGQSPSLCMPEPESARRAAVSGALSALLHLGLLGAMVLVAWLTPKEAIQRIIPVQIIQEKPGSNEAPAPARPKALRPRRPRAVTPRTVQRVAPRAPAQPRVNPIQAQAIQMDRLDATRAPTELRRRQVSSQHQVARQTTAVPRAAAAPLAAVDVRPTDLSAPEIDFDGPRQIAPGTQAEIAAPEAFSEIADVNQIDYQAAAPDAVFASQGETDGSAYSAVDIDTGVATEFAEGGVVGGTGTAVGVVPCKQSAFVRRYLADVEARVKARWQIPPNTPANEEVILVFSLDASGTATSIEFKGDVDPAFGRSAIEAMQAASPFAPMDDNVRCMTEIRWEGTFVNAAD